MKISFPTRDQFPLCCSIRSLSSDVEKYFSFLRICKNNKMNHLFVYRHHHSRSHRRMWMHVTSSNATGEHVICIFFPSRSIIRWWGKFIQFQYWLKNIFIYWKTSEICEREVDCFCMEDILTIFHEKFNRLSCNLFFIKMLFKLHLHSTNWVVSMSWWCDENDENLIDKVFTRRIPSLKVNALCEFHWNIDRNNLK